MSDLSLRLVGPRIVRPIAEYALWPAYFTIARAFNQEAFFITAIFLILTADLIDSPTRTRALIRDLTAGMITAALGIAIGDQLGLIAGAVIAASATIKLYLSS
jgi:hypothetical protein